MTKITVDKALIEQAISALADTQTDGESPQWDIEKAAYDALRAALVEPAVEPVAWRAKDANGRWMYGGLPAPELPVDAPQLLFASPPPPAEVPLLTPEELIDAHPVLCGLTDDDLEFARAIEQAVRQKAGLQ